MCNLISAAKRTQTHVTSVCPVSTVDEHVSDAGGEPVKNTNVLPSLHPEHGPQ